MERKDAIRGAYRLTGGNNFYDGMITCSTLSGKAVCRVGDEQGGKRRVCLPESGLNRIQRKGGEEIWKPFSES